jgi:hypothetical protein
MSRVHKLDDLIRENFGDVVFALRSRCLMVFDDVLAMDLARVAQCYGVVSDCDLSRTVGPINSSDLKKQKRCQVGRELRTIYNATLYRRRSRFLPFSLVRDTSSSPYPKIVTWPPLQTA